MVFTFLKARGVQVGSSLVEADKLGLAQDLEQQAELRGVELLLPSDVVVADRFAADADTRIVPFDAIPEGWMVRAHIASDSQSLSSVGLLHACADMPSKRTISSRLQAK